MTEKTLTIEKAEMTNCKNCDIPVKYNYCSNCGQAVQLKRVDSHYVVHEIQHVIHFEKGIFYTIKELLIRPGENIREFITDNRSRLIKPTIFIIITSLIYTSINHFFHIEKGYINYQGPENSAVALIFEWVEGHYGYANIIMGAFIAFWLKLFFKKYDYNFFEILILLCFVIGMGMLILAAFALIEGLTHKNVLMISGVTGILYCVWAIGQFFDKRKVISYVKALFAYLLGTITLLILAILTGILIDVISKH